MTSYLFDQAWQAEHDRLTALQDQTDSATKYLLRELGVGQGDVCLEVGCGAGGIAMWLADQVGPEGRVVATDLDPRFLRDHGYPNLEVRRHDVVTDDLELSTYDVVHARAVLEHLPERDRALARMVAATRPGGLVLIEDLDIGGPMQWTTRHSRPAEHADLGERVGGAIVSLFRAVGADPDFACRLPDVLTAAGLVDVGAEIRNALTPGGPTTFFALTVTHLGPALVQSGLATADDVESYLAVLRDPGYRGAMIPVLSAWGRKPG